MITIKNAKANFFDREKVLNAVDRETVRVLSRLGAFVRTRARTSIRKRKGVSSPGSPPHSHVGLLRDLILFSFDEASRSVVIGPTLISRPTGAPALLEYGGASVRFQNGRPVRLRYRPRPYMRPALAAELPNLPAHFRGPASIV